MNNRLAIQGTDYLDALPTDASALDTKLARQAQLRTLTRKYAADIDGVLRWAQESRERLAHGRAES